MYSDIVADSVYLLTTADFDLKFISINIFFCLLVYSQGQYSIKRTEINTSKERKTRMGV